MLDKTRPVKVDNTDGEKTFIHISPPNMGIATYRLIGTSPLMVSAFTQKAIIKMKAQQEAGSRAKSKKEREAKDFQQAYKDAMHISEDGWCGMPAGAFRTAMVDACRLVGYAMTKAKLAIFIESDGLDSVVKTPLVRITGKPEMNINPERNESGVMDLRARPLWMKWEINPFRIRFDQDMFGIDDVTNLLMRAGAQVGIGEGRPNSRNSTGIGYGLFDVKLEFDLVTKRKGK
jgi:hypothetical protein